MVIFSAIFNHRLRNFAAKYRWAMIDNEPDWVNNHPLGYRPNRKHIHRRPYAWCFSLPRYTNFCFAREHCVESMMRSDTRSWPRRRKRTEHLVDTILRDYVEHQSLFWEKTVCEDASLVLTTAAVLHEQPLTKLRTLLCSCHLCSSHDMRSSWIKYRSVARHC